ncbi:MAG: ABC transporter permease [bacterium]
MPKYIFKRLISSILTLFAVSILTFILMHSIPGGPFTGERELSPEVEKQLNEKYNLDAPLHIQYIDYMSDLIIRGDFGPSFKYQGKSVNDFIADGFPNSAKLGFISVIVILIISIPLGIIAALKNGKWQDVLTMTIATIGVTIPSFVTATLLMYVFSYRLGWLPTFGIDKWTGFILPVVALSGYSLSFMTRLTRSSILEVLNQDYVRTAHAKGMSETRVITKHVLRNALIPLITILGPTVAGLLTGSFVIEKIFAIPGMGVYFISSIVDRDYTTIMGITIFYATFLIAMVFIVDIFYCLIDPRIKYD